MVHYRSRRRRCRTGDDGLEHLIRYSVKPPLSLELLTRAADGRVVLSLHRPLHDGTTAVAFTPMDLMKRLAAIVPRPGATRCATSASSRRAPAFARR
jgi:hypothetical protein